MSQVESIFALPRKKRTAVLNLLAEEGMTPDRLLALLSAPKQAVRQWVEASPGTSSVITVDLTMIYDAKRIGILLGVETPDTPAPAPSRPEERIIFLPPCIASPTDLRRTKAPMWDQDWYDGKGDAAKPGYWGVILPGPD